VASATRDAGARAAIVALTIVALDQLTKALVRGSLRPGHAHHVIPGVLSLVRTTNTGVAFSLLRGGSAIVTALALAVLLALLAYFVRHATQPLLWLATGMIAGGAVGNLIDRLRIGAVTDFIKLPDWPAFNLADSAITIGVIVLVLVIGRDGAARPR
jgi:signal peptidase II